MTTVSTEHIWLDDRGVAWVDDTNTKVVEIVLDKVANGLNPEAIAYQHYGQLSLDQIHAALAYYYDHQTAFDAEIERQAREAEALRAQNLDSPGRKCLRAVEERMNHELPRGVDGHQCGSNEMEQAPGEELASRYPDVDVSLIDYLLSLTPTERLLRHEQALIFVEELRRAGREYYGFDPRAVIEANGQTG